MIKNNYWSYDFVEATQFMIDNCDEKIIAMYHITADDRVMGGINKAKKLTQTVQNSTYTTDNGDEKPRIVVSTLCPNSDKAFDTDSYAYKLAALSGGIAVTGVDMVEETEMQVATVEMVGYLSSGSKNSTSGTVTKSLKQVLGEGNEGVYNVISSAGWTTIKLNKPLTEDSDEDYDKDGLSDWDEVNTTLIYNMYVKHNHSYTPIIIALFIVILISAVLSFVAQAISANSILCWILMAVELGSTIVLGFYSEKRSVDNSTENMNEYINECQMLYKEVFQNYFKSKEQLNILLDRANDEIAKLQIKIDKKYDDLKKINQILIIPIILAIIKALWDSTSNISVLMETSLIAIMIYLTIYAVTIAAIALINYDIVRQKDKLQSFVDDLQGIIDVMDTFALSDNMLISNEESEINN